jgi:hypothetical protein
MWWLQGLLGVLANGLATATETAIFTGRIFLQGVL